MATVRDRRHGRRVAGAAVLLLALAATAAGAWWAWPRLFPGPVAQGLRAYDRGEWARAEELAKERLRSVDRDDLEALRLLARASARQEDDDSAQALYRRIGAEAMTAEDLYLLALGLLRQDQRELAWGALDLAESKAPRHPGVILELGRLALEENQVDRAEEYADRLADRPGWESPAALLLGRVQEARFDTAGAAEAYSEALAADPALDRGDLDPAEARKRLARALLGLGRAAAARADLGAIAEPDAEARWLLSRARLQLGDIDGAVRDRAAASGYGADDPTTPEPAPYVGARRCADCHSAIYHDQQSSRHAQTFRRNPGPGDGLPALPDGPVADPDIPGLSHELKYEGDRLVAEAHDGGRAYRALVEYALGSGDRGLTLVGTDQDGQLRELRMTHYGGDVGWDRTTGHPEQVEGPDRYLGEPLTSESRTQCLGCHTTNPYIARTGTGPAARDRAIGCELCHGPGGNHVAAVERGFPELAIGRPKVATAAQVVDLCGRCHRPPDGSPVGPSDHPAAVRFQAATFVRSPCYLRSDGGLDCTTCHDPHRNAETSPAHYRGDLPVVPPRPRRRAPPGAGHRTPCPVNPSNDCLAVTCRRWTATCRTRSSPTTTSGSTAGRGEGPGSSAPAHRASTALMGFRNRVPAIRSSQGFSMIAPCPPRSLW